MRQSLSATLRADFHLLRAMRLLVSDPEHRLSSITGSETPRQLPWARAFFQYGQWDSSSVTLNTGFHPVRALRLLVSDPEHGLPSITSAERTCQYPCWGFSSHPDHCPPQWSGWHNFCLLNFYYQNPSVQEPYSQSLTKRTNSPRFRQAHFDICSPFHN